MISNDSSDLTGAFEPGWQRARRAFEGAGFNLVAVVDPATLPPSAKQQLGPDQTSFGLLLAAGGRDLYTAMGSSASLSASEPFDAYTVGAVERVFRDCLPDVEFEIAYPGTGPAPLIALGEYLGWSHPSPLGLGINPEYGLWFAYRAFVRVSIPLPVTEPIASESPCESCIGRDCVPACPAGAVNAVGTFEIKTCADFRLGRDSTCAATCLARLACPVANRHQYETTQFAYHQQRALVGLKRWQNKQ